MKNRVRTVARASSVRRRFAAAPMLAAAGAAVVGGLSVFTGRTARAANLYWDPSPTNPGFGVGSGSGGTGSWDTTTPNWFNGSAGTADVAWPNATPLSTAVFAGNAGTVTVTTLLNVQGLTFNTSGYTIAGGTTNTFNVGGSGITMTALTGGTVNVNQALTMIGVQSWALGATNTLNLGTGVAGTGGGSTGQITVTSGTVNYTGTVWTSAPLIVTNSSGGSGSIFNFSGTAFSPSKLTVSGGGTFNSTGTASIPSTGTYTAVGDGTSGTLNVSGGTFTTAATLFLGNTVVANATDTGIANVTGATLNTTSTINIGDGYNNNGNGIGVLNIGLGGLVSTGTAIGNIRLGNIGSGNGTINLNAGGTLSTNATIAPGGFATTTAGFTKGSTFNFSGGTLQATGTAMSLPSTVAVNVLDGGATVDTNTFSDTIAANLSSGGTGIGGLTKIGVGVLTLSGTNTYGGGTTISGGTLAVAAPISLPGYATPGKISVASGAFLSLGYNGSAGFGATDIATVQANATFAAGSGLGLDVNSATAVTYSNNLGGFTNFIKTNSGTLTLAGTNSYLGTTTAAAGFIAEPSTAALGTTSGLVLGSGTSGGGYSSIGSGETITLPITLGGTTGGGVLDASGTGAVVVNGAIAVANAGTKTLTLQGTGAATNTLNSNLSNGAGTLALAKGTADTWVVSGSNSYTGGTTINAGYLQPTNNAALGTGTVTINGVQTTNASNGGTLLLTGGLTLANAINVPARYDPIISTPQSTPHVENVAGANTLAGNLTDTSAGGSGIILQSDAGTLTVSGAINNSSGSSYNRPIFFTGAGNFVTTGAILQNTTISGLSITKEGTGTVAVNGTGSNFSGGSLIEGGTLLANATAALGTGTTVINQSGGVLAGTGTTGGPVTILAGGVITAGTGAAGTIGALGTGTLNVSGGQYTVKLNGTDSAPATAGSGASGTAGSVNDELVLAGLTFNGGSSTLTIAPALLSTPAATGTYSYLVATGPAGAFGTASAVLSQLTVSQTAPGIGTFALSTDALGDSLYVDFVDTAAAPEPASLMLVGLAAAPLIVGRRRRAANS